MSNLPQQNPYNQYVADGVTAVYAYTPWLILLPTDIAVYVTAAGALPNPTNDIQPYSTAYTVQNVGNLTGGTITFQAGYIPANGSIITLLRDMQTSINTNFADPQTFNGQNLDDALERVVLIEQQNDTAINQRVLSYAVNSYTTSSNTNVVPTLGANQFWVGAPSGNGQVQTLTFDDNQSVLRSQLADEQSGQDGALLVGLYVGSNPLMGSEVTVNEFANSLQDNSVSGQTGASYLGFFNNTTSAATNVDAALNAVISAIVNTLVPTGTILLYGGTTAPAGFLLGIGTAVSRTTYANLFAIYGTTYGPGDGSTTFNLPDLPNRFPVGAGGAYALATTGGATETTLVAANIPSTITFLLAGGGPTGFDAGTNTQTTGAGAPFSILNPYLALNYIIKT